MGQVRYVKSAEAVMVEQERQRQQAEEEEVDYHDLVRMDVMVYWIDMETRQAKPATLAVQQQAQEAVRRESEEPNSEASTGLAARLDKVILNNYSEEVDQDFHLKINRNKKLR